MQSQFLNIAILLGILLQKVRADCYRDNNWNVALVNQHTFWAAVTDDGHDTRLEYALCLVQETQQCTYCSTIVADKVVFPNSLLPCLVGLQTDSHLPLLANDTKDAGSTGEDFDAWKTILYLDPPRRISAIRCHSS